ncbi:MAG: SRPBCC domain-containing protein [Chitinophagales bacterium]
MSTANFTTTIVVNQTPKEVFDALNHVRGWWSESIKGNTEELNGEFHYHYEDVHRCTMKIIESVPEQKVVWLVLENYFKFTKDTNEWTGDKIVFDITEKDSKTELRMTQQGLTSAYECFDICKDAWTNYIQKSLKNLIETGKGYPNGKGKPQTENEKKLSSDDK